MSNPYLGEIRIVGFNFAPQGWAFCNGQLLPINQNQALFSILGTTFGGNGQTTFALPNLQGRSPYAWGGNVMTLGQTGGEFAHTLNINEMPAHTHTAMGSNTPGNTVPPATAGGQKNTWATSTQNPYIPDLNTGANIMAAGTVGNTGGSQPHENMSPYTVLNFCIALQGLFPSHN